MNHIKLRIQNEIKNKYKAKKDYRLNQKKLKSKLTWNKTQAYNLRRDQRNKKYHYEIIFKNLLDEFGINYIWQNPFYDKNRYVCVDFYFPKNRIVVEIDGFFHSKKQNSKKDNIRTDYLIQHHDIKEVIRISNNSLRDKNKIVDLLFDKLD